MNDKQIIDLYWARDETAISETAGKYSKYCHSIAYRILHNDQDSEECVNDTWLRTWSNIPPQRPSLFKAFLGAITRNLSLDRYEQYTAEKRGFGEIPLALEELRECIPDQDSSERIVEDIALAELFDQFLASLPSERRMLFVLRYWHMYPVKEIALARSMGESKVKMSLMKTRKELKQFLEQEGITL